jgi:hypothetical protein
VRAAAVAFLLAAVVAAGLATLAGPVHPLAEILAVLAGGLGAGAGFLAMYAKLRAPTPAARESRPARVESPFEPAPMLSLSRALSEGTLGRRLILATLRAIERRSGGAGFPVLTVAEEDRLFELPDPAFREWVERRLDVLEART